MNKYCTNCGNKLQENADICVKCGKFISKTPNNNARVDSGIVYSIVGMSLGIIGFLIALFFSLVLTSIRSELIYEELLVRLFVSIFFTIIPLAPSIPSLILSVMGIKKKKTI